jgi:hypothetical protein
MGWTTVELLGSNHDKLIQGKTFIYVKTYNTVIQSICTAKTRKKTIPRRWTDEINMDVGDSCEDKR